MNYAHQISVRSAPGGGVSAIDCIQLLRFDLHLAQGITISDTKKEKENIQKSWDKNKKQKDFIGVESFNIQGYSTPVLMTQRQLQALINTRTYSLISHSFRVKYLEDLCKLLPEEERELPKHLLSSVASLTSSPQERAGTHSKQSLTTGILCRGFSKLTATEKGCS